MSRMSACTRIGFPTPLESDERPPRKIGGQYPQVLVLNQVTRAVKMLAYLSFALRQVIHSAGIRPVSLARISVVSGPLVQDGSAATMRSQAGLMARNGVLR